MTLYNIPGVNAVNKTNRIIVFWDVTYCIWLDGYQWFRRACCLDSQTQCW